MLKTLFGKTTPRVISAQEAKQRLDSGDPVLLLDVRTREEYEAVHIPGSRLLPLDSLESGIAKLTPDRDTEMIVYCLSGARADAACRRLSAMGYTNVSNMGGIRSWKYETVSGR